MKTHCFGLYYLGGPVELLRLREHLRPVYPGATPVSRREEMVLQIPLVSRTIPAASGQPEVRYEATNYQFGHGYGLALFTFESDRPIPDLTAMPARFIFQQAELAGAIFAYLFQALGVKGISEIDGVASTRERRLQLKLRTGIQVIPAGLNEIRTGFMTTESCWLVGKDVPGLDTSKAEDQSEKFPGLILRLGPGHYWSPAENEEVLWDLVLLELRELSGRYLRDAAVGWLARTQTQLEQLSATLEEHNRVVGNQVREEVEHFDVNFHQFATSARRRLIDGDTTPLGVVDRQLWNRQSDFQRQQELAGKALDEAHRAIEGMTRPLDFREFQLLKTGVEEVEGRIMLLTVLLVLMELVTLAIEPGHWTSKGILLVLVILIPVGFLFFERWRREAVVRRGRGLLTRQRLVELGRQIAELEQEMKRSQSDDVMAADIREGLGREMNEVLARLKARQDELSAELRKRG
jgi:hypothetical protein